MSSALDGYSGGKGYGEELEAWYDALCVKYPNLAKALLGNEETTKDGPVRPPFTLMINRKGGALRMCLSSPEASKTWFGPSVDPNDVLGSVEMALAHNQGEWSPKNGQRASKPRF
jgi:hypothetical protein